MEALDSHWPIQGAGLYLTGTSTVDNCTVVYNYSGGLAPGLYAIGPITLSNNVFWSNESKKSAEQIYLSQVPSLPTEARITNCAIEGGQSGVLVSNGATLVWGSGNVEQPPQFIGQLGKAARPTSKRCKVSCCSCVDFFILKFGLKF